MRALAFNPIRDKGLDPVRRECSEWARGDIAGGGSIVMSYIKIFALRLYGS